MDYLECLNKIDENETLEAKTASDISQPILKTICAFANGEQEREHVLLLGVAKDPNAKRYTITGISDPDKLSTDLTTKCRGVFNQMLSPSITPVCDDGKIYLVVKVLGVRNTEKPVYLKKMGIEKGIFKRIGSSTVQCSLEDYRKFIQDASAENYDETLLPDSEKEDISTKALMEYRRIKSEVNPNASELEWNDEELLYALKAIKKDKEGNFRLTVAGLLLFGTDLALRRLRPMAKIDYIRIIGKEWVEDPETRWDSSFEIRTYLFEAIKRSLNRILEDLPVRSSFKKDALQREDMPLIPLKVLREAIVNAVMHRSYRENSPIQIIQYSDRIEVYNIGHSLKPESQLTETGSIPRNPTIAACLSDTRFSENKGSGVRSMIKMMKEAGLKEPVFKSDREGNTFRAIYYFQHFLNEESIGWLKQFSAFRLTSEESRALIYVKEHGQINNATYRDLNKVDTNQASGILKKLCKNGILKKEGSGRHTVYTLCSRPKGVNDNLPDKSGSIPDKKDASIADKSGSIPDKKDASIADKVTSIPDKKDVSIADKVTSIPDKKDVSIADKVTSIPDKKNTNVPETLQLKIDALGKRTSPALLRKIIFNLCTLKPMSAADLAGILNRNVGYLMEHYLTPAIKSGDLVFLFPDSIQHPQQAYKIPENSLSSDHSNKGKT